MSKHGLAPYLAIQISEMQEHAYYMGERLGRPVSFDEAAIEWTTGTERHDKRFYLVFEGHLDGIEAACNDACGGWDKCPGLKNPEPGCVLSRKKIHELLED